MKKLFLTAITALMAVMVSSCKKDNDELDNPNGTWSVELTADYVSTVPSDDRTKMALEIAGTGTVTIDWGDGIVLKDLPMPELKLEEHYDEYGDEDDWWYEGVRFTHRYDKVGKYPVKVTGRDGSVILLNICVDDSNEGNRYTSLVLDQCRQLEYLDCRDNRLTSLDVSRCIKLKTLWCGENQLTSLNVNGCTQLKYLDCYDNSLTSLDMSKCTKLKILGCEKNKLTSLNVNGYTQLKELWCYENQLLSLDVSKCTQLKELRCYENQLISLNVSGCTQLQELNIQKNLLSVAATNQIYNNLPIVNMGIISVDRATAGNYYIAENKGWRVNKY